MTRALALTLPLLFVVGCCDKPIVAARKAIVKASTTLQATEADAQIVTEEVLKLVAEKHRKATLETLKTAGCSEATSQPATASEACKKLAEDGRTAYLLASRKIALAAEKVRAVVGATHATFLAALVTVGQIERGTSDFKDLAALVKRIADQLANAIAIYQEYVKLVNIFKAGGMP